MTSYQNDSVFFHHLSRPEGALEQVRLGPHPLVVLEVPLQRRLVRVDLGLYVRVRQEPPVVGFSGSMVLLLLDSIIPYLFLP